ncbi:hypothetical protein [Massilia timonae]|uniref:hypothetical protein n=1 Tax=Massilia timonae TaxID=47229 RepID=UPI0028991E66|nr:hypothetical protein [Massilia timonae]
MTPIFASMAYLDQFISALRFYFDLYPTEASRPDFGRLQQHFQQNQSPLLAPLYEGTRAFTAHLAEQFVAGYPGEIAHACHAASAGFLKSWELSRPDGLPASLAMTVGSVRFKGQPVFETNRTAVASLVHAGRDPGTDLPVHVWLTLDDLTVVDLTIVPTLVRQGQLPSGTAPVLYWRHDTASDYEFEPVLVDNLFFERIDSGTFTAPKRG